MFIFRAIELAFLNIDRSGCETSKTKNQDPRGAPWKAAQRSLCRAIEIAPGRAEGAVRAGTHPRPRTAELSRKALPPGPTPIV